VKVPAALKKTMQVDWSRLKLRIPATGERVRVIVSLPDQLVTGERIISAPICEGEVVAVPEQDLLKMAVVDRHKASAAVGLGLIAGIGLRQGAIAGTIAHDHHNLVIIGADDVSMLTAAKAVGTLGGGLAVALGNQVLASLPLPVAGLMSDRPIAEVRAGYDSVITAAKALNSGLHNPFMAMSFMALEVIPKLKLTDQGLVDVEQFEVVELFV